VRHALQRGRGVGRDARFFSPLAAQIVLAVIGCYAGIYGLVRIRGMLTKKPVPAAPAPGAVTTTLAVGDNKYGFEFPTAENFDEWEKNDANWAAWEKFMDSGKFVRCHKAMPSQPAQPGRAR